MSKQECTPSRIFGGNFSQYLFLGCSVRSVSCSVGWNEQQSTCDVELVQDPCQAPRGNEKIYFDQNLNRKTTRNADPGFTAPNVGSPAYLRLEDFEFSGLIQSHEQTGSEAGNPTYKVTLVDPRIVLQGTQVIIGDYAGNVYNAPNVLNAYGFAESFGMICPFRQVLGAYFGSPAGAFGGAGLNDNGMRWNTIKDSVSLLTSAIPAQISQFSSLGRIVYIGSANPGYGSMKSDFLDVDIPLYFPQQTPYQSFYFVDLSEIPNAPAYYRISGTSISLLDLISTVCEDSGCDYYVELIPVMMGGRIAKIIKIRVAVRGVQPVLGRIEAFVEAAGNVISKSIGRELRNETTSNFIIGGNVETVYQATDSDLIEPYWGLDEYNNIIPTEYDDDGKINFTVSIRGLNSLLYQPLSIDVVTITEYELQSALTGQDAWLAIASSLPSDLGTELGVAGILDATRILAVLNNVGFPHHLIVPGKKAGGGIVNFDDLKNESMKLKDIETIYNFVLNYAREFYGKKYIVRVPYTCCRIDDESLQTQSTESPTDSGWTEYATVIGLPNPSFTDIFKNDQGKIEPFARFETARDTIEISNVPEEDYILLEDDEDSTLFLRGSSLLDEFVFEDYNMRFNPHVVIELASPILLRLADEDLHRTKEFANKFFTVINNARVALGLPGPAGPAPVMNDILKNAGNSLLHLGITSEFKKPDAIAVPIRNNVLTYGPWVAAGPAGLTNIEKDDGLVPWEYGSVESMDLAGNQKVTQGVTYMQVGEMGSVTIPGYPALPLGAELLYSGISTVENRSITSNNSPDVTNSRKTEKGKWDATSGSAPSISPKLGDYYIISKSGNTELNGTSDWQQNNLIVHKNNRWEQQLNPQSIYISLSGSPWIGSFGPNITGINVDIGEQGLQTTYSLRTYTPKFGRFSKRNADRIQEYSQIINSVAKRQRLIALQEFKIQTNRQRSTDRIFSNRLGNPFSAFAASPPGVLTGQIVSLSSGKKTTGVHVIKHNELLSEIDKYESKAMMSLDGIFRPVSKAGSGGLPRYAHFDIGCLKNTPTAPEPPVLSYSYSGITQTQLDPWQTGHDIDILARGTEIPNNLSIPLDDYNYTSDYRGLALKGPILLQQPGYDIQGKPIPNIVDTEANMENGIFANYGLKDAFYTDFLTKPNTWPVAPVDLRFDRKRGVWVSPQPYRSTVFCTLVNDLVQDENDAHVTDGNTIENANGVVTEKSVKVYNYLRFTAKAGDGVLASYDSSSCKYIIIAVQQSITGSPIAIYKATASSVSNPKKPYDTVTATLCTNLDGRTYLEDNPFSSEVEFVNVTIRLPKHHIGTATIDVNYNSATHMHDVRAGDILVCSYVTEYVSVGVKQTSVVAISDYSREHSIFYGVALQDSKAPNFPDFTAQIRTPDNEIGEFELNPPINVKNRLRQPILTGDCCFLYRHKGLLNSIVPELWLMQGIFTPLCIVSDIRIGTQGINVEGGEISNSLLYGTYPYSVPAYSKTLTFEITDVTLYTESAYKINDPLTGNTYMGMVVDTDVISQCCSAPPSEYRPSILKSAYQIDIQAFYLNAECNIDNQQNDQGFIWSHADSTVSQGGPQCDPTDVTFSG